MTNSPVLFSNPGLCFISLLLPVVDWRRITGMMSACYSPSSSRTMRTTCRDFGPLRWPRIASCTVEYATPFCLHQASSVVPRSRNNPITVSLFIIVVSSSVFVGFCFMALRY